MTGERLSEKASLTPTSIRCRARSELACASMNSSASTMPRSRQAFARLTQECPGSFRRRLQHSGMRIGYLVDPDGSLLHLVQNA